jgi:hypothetical protein
MRMLTKLCFTMCIICIVVGTVLSMAMIWGAVSDREFLWKCWLSVSVMFLASALTLAVARTLGSGSK